AAAACSLNPQPFPPDTPDAAGGANDAGKGYDSSTFGEAGSTEDAGSDGAPVPELDGGADASEDVTTDAPGDAVADAPADAVDDVTSD
ncbi:MAG TPA: hypothetical protein VH054_00535, partial [Polyangiaceae bacterium]|nr:hypothetical protein [Polyangiaceae bacterium]